VALAAINQNIELAEFIRALARSLMGFDWRTSSFPNLSRVEQRHKAAYRGGGGYGLLRRDLLSLLRGAENPIGEAAREVEDRLGP
jgi:hypothetical protein